MIRRIANVVIDEIRRRHHHLAGKIPISLEVAVWMEDEEFFKKYVAFKKT